MKDKSGSQVPTDAGKSLKEYLFDVTLTAGIKVVAASRKEAEDCLRTKLATTECQAGAWEDGTPLVFSVAVEGELDLAEVNGEPCD